MATNMIKLSLLPRTLIAVDQHAATKQHSIALVAKRNDIADILNGELPVSVKDFQELIKLAEEAENLTGRDKPPEVADVAVTLGPEDDDLNPNGAMIRNVYIATKRLMEAVCKVQEVVYMAADKGAELWDVRDLSENEDKENMPSQTLTKVVKLKELDENLKRRAQAIRSYNDLTSFDSLREEEEKKRSAGR